jgi:hypothetical protein
MKDPQTLRAVDMRTSLQGADRERSWPLPAQVGAALFKQKVNRAQNGSAETALGAGSNIAACVNECGAGGEVGR